MLPDCFKLNTIQKHYWYNQKARVKLINIKHIYKLIKKKVRHIYIYIYYVNCIDVY